MMYALQIMETLNTGLGIVIAVLAILANGVALVLWGARMNSRVERVESEALALRGYHKDHFAATGEMKVTTAQMRQQLDSHVAEDARQFSAVKEEIHEGREELRDMRREIFAAIEALRTH